MNQGSDILILKNKQGWKGEMGSDLLPQITTHNSCVCVCQNACFVWQQCHVYKYASFAILRSSHFTFPFENHSLTPVCLFVCLCLSLSTFLYLSVCLSLTSSLSHSLSWQSFVRLLNIVSLLPSTIRCRVSTLFYYVYTIIRSTY